MSRKGFTLIELLVVVAVLALLASIVFSNLGGAREGARISNTLSFQSQTHLLLGSDLIGWWNFNDSGARYKDLSGYGNHGSCVTSCPIPIDGIPGTFGTALEFNGIDNRLNLTIIEPESITISIWLNLKSYSNSINNTSHHVYPTSDGLGIAGSSTTWIRTGGTRRYLSLGANIGLNEWSHLILTYDSFSGDNKVWLNGKLGNQQNLGAGTAIDWGGGVLRLSHSSWETNGAIDDVRIYSRALTASEIQTLYAQTAPRLLGTGL